MNYKLYKNIFDKMVKFFNSGKISLVGSFKKIDKGGDGSLNKN
jgi:hypothetical protein